MADGGEGMVGLRTSALALSLGWNSAHVVPPLLPSRLSLPCRSPARTTSLLPNPGALPCNAKKPPPALPCSSHLPLKRCCAVFIMHVCRYAMHLHFLFVLIVFRLLTAAAAQAVAQAQAATGRHREGF